MGDQEPGRRAAARIEKAGARARSIALRRASLTTVPPELRSLHDLRKLDLAANQLTELPDWLAELPIEELDLSVNPLREVPTVVLALPRLRVLRLRATSVRTLPAALAERALTSLAISGALEDAAAIERCESLEILSVSDTPRLHALPSLARLGRLRELFIEGSALPALPDDVPASVRVVRAQLSALERWPERGLLGVVDVDLRGASKLRALPPSLLDAPSLERLVVAAVAIELLTHERPPAKLRELAAGSVLAPEGTAALAAWAASGPALERLTLTGTFPPHATLRLPSAVFDAPRLVHLAVSGWKLHVESEGAARAPIRTLQLAHDALSSLPDVVTHLDHLETLDVSENEISMLPPIDALPPSLRHVDLRGNRVRPTWARDGLTVVG